MIDVAHLVPELPAKPDFNTGVLLPLRAAQAKEQERLAALEAARKLAEAQEAQRAVEAARTAQAATAVPTMAYSGDVAALIIQWANHYAVSSALLLRVANCESGLRVTASNPNYYAGGGNPSGIFQFLPQTFYANAVRAGVASPDLWNPDHQAHTAAYMFSIGQSGQWECK